MFPDFLYCDGLERGGGGGPRTIDPNASDWLLMINLAKADDLLGAQEYRQNYTAGPATIQGMFQAPLDGDVNL